MPETADEIVPEVKASINQHLLDYLRSGGAEGHILDATAAGGHALGTMCLIRYRGRRTGRSLITPLAYTHIGGEIVVVASKGGAPAHPAWYLNLVAVPGVEFQIATQAFRGSWRELAGDERDAAWAQVVASYPFYAGYQAATDRVIPLVAMTPVEPRPVFSEAELEL